MSLHVVSFGGGISLDGSADTQRTDEVQAADSFDIGNKGALVVTTDPSDYLELDDNGTPSPWTALWALLEAAGFNFSKVVAVGEGVNAGSPRYIMTSFAREGEVSPFLWGSGGSVFGQGTIKAPLLPPLAQGVVVTGCDFAGIFPLRFAAEGAPPAGAAQQVRLYLINIGAREGTAPNVAPGLYMIAVVPPLAIPFANPIGRFDSLGTGSSGLLTVPNTIPTGEQIAGVPANGGTNGRQLYFRAILAYNNHVFGWGYDSADEKIGIITGITNANPGEVTSVAHGLASGDSVTIRGVIGMTQVNSQTPYTITVTGANTFTIGVDTTAFGVYGSVGVWVKGNGDGPAKVMFSNLGQPLKWGNDNRAAIGTDRLFTDSDAIQLGDAGEIIRAGLVWDKRAIFGTNNGLHYVAGYGRDSYIADGANPIMRSYNVVGPKALIEGPDKKLYGVSEQGLWRMSSIEAVPEPLYEQLRDYRLRSNGYWDQIWTDVTRSALTYPGTTNQDLVWMAVDWERHQVIVGIPWCSIANGYGYGTDTVILKYHVSTGGFTRQQFAGVQYTAAGYFRSVSQQAATRMLGTPTAGQKTVKRYGYQATKNDTLVLPSTLPLARYGPYAPFGADSRGTVRRLYVTLAADTLGAYPFGLPMLVAGITNANPAEVTVGVPHNLKSGQKVDIHGALGMLQVNGGPYTITVTGALTFTLNGVNATAFGIFGPPPAFVTLPLAWGCTLMVDESQVGATAAVVSGLSSTFALSLRGVAPGLPAAGDIWVDSSNQDPNLGNARAGAIIPAIGGYIARVRRDNFLRAITGATKANPCVITCPSHGLSTFQCVSINSVAGMTQLNNDADPGPFSRDYSVAIIDTDHFSLIGIDSSGFGVYTSGGTVALAWALIPGMGGGAEESTGFGYISGSRLTIPIPVVRRTGTRVTFDMQSTILARRFQFEGFGINPDGKGRSA